MYEYVRNMMYKYKTNNAEKQNTTHWYFLGKKLMDQDSP